MEYLTEAPPSDVKLLVANQPFRPMLARVADSMYWLARYVERAEHVARVVLENSQLLTDVGEMQPKLKLELWKGVLRVFSLEQNARAAELLNAADENLAHRVSAFMALDAANPNSLLSCITSARENARGVRENISGEMWENLNALYWSLQGEEGRARFEESPQEVYRQVMVASMLFQGQTDQTLAHSQGWLFIQLAKYFERIDMTCRIVEAKFELLQSDEFGMETGVRNIHWMSLLRSCASIEAYRRAHPAEIDPLRVAAFLVLERHFPRTIRSCVHHAHDSIRRIRAGIDAHSADAAERILGRLNTQLEYAEASELLAEGLPKYLRHIQLSMVQAAEAVKKTYFLY